MDVSKLSKEEKIQLLNQLQAEAKNEKIEKKEAFESIKAKFIYDVEMRFNEYIQHGKDFMAWLRGECESYMDILREYGQLKRGDDQLGFKCKSDTFELDVKGRHEKGFDERADIAEKRLVDFLNDWIEKNNPGGKNPISKLAMSMIQRNESGDLDYKSISQLYDLEEDFNDPEYSEIMSLFRESNTVEGMVIKFYFKKKDKYNNWVKVEPSFNRM